MKLLRRVLIAFAALLVVLFSVVGVLLVTRRAPSGMVVAFGQLGGPAAVTDSAFARTVALYTDAIPRTGHRVELLLDGATFSQLWRDLRGARRSITFQSYFGHPGALADTLSAVLRERARAGVNVRFLYDAFGSSFEDEWLERLRADGVRVGVFRPFSWYSLHKASNRSHVRAVVIDGVLGYTGGFGIADDWLGDGVTRGWRETNVRFTGPAVAQLQASFAGGWAEATGEMLVGELWFPPIAPAEDGILAALLHAEPSLGVPPASRLLALSFAAARRTLWITNSYFVPDRALRRQLLLAARRGVDVRLLLPGDSTDVPITRYAARSDYEQLLRAGIRIFEYQPQMVHSKTFVIDGAFASVGSLNLDARSLYFNTEIGLLVYDRAFGARMDSIFLADLAHAREIRLAEFVQRPWSQKLRETFGDLVSRFL